MPHKLANPKHSAIENPLTMTLRYRCGCANNEVITISVVLNSKQPEFVWEHVFKQALSDLRTEIAQHIRG